MDRKKNCLILSCVLSLSFFVLQISCQLEPSSAGNESSYRAVAETGEIKSYSNATMEEAFADDRVAIVLNKSVSMNFKEYTPEDFPEIQCTRVMDATRLTMEVVKQQLEAQRTGDWSALRERIEVGMLVDIEKFRRILYLELPKKSKENVLVAIKMLERKEDILYAGPDYKMELCSDPYSNITNYGTKTEIYSSISMPQAWANYSGSNKIRVGIMDSGIDVEHPFLSNRIDDDFYSGLNRDFSDYSLNGVISIDMLQDPLGHGTHVAGIVADVTSVNLNIELVSLRICVTKNEIHFSSVSNAIDYATAKYIHILNISAAVKRDKNLLLDIDDIKASIQVYPGLLIAAAGNEGYTMESPYNPILAVDTHSFPAYWTKELSNVISVGAYTLWTETTPYVIRRGVVPDLGWENEKHPYPNRVGSNYGHTTVDLFAPGTAILSTYPLWKCNDGSHNTSTHVSPGYHWESGTSMAAPFVTGVAALIMAKNPSMSPSTIKALINNSVDKVPLGSDLYYFSVSGGTLNAAKALGVFTTGFGGGSGTSNDPYLIKNVIHLKNIAQHQNANIVFEIVNDIDFDEWVWQWNGWKPWTPIPRFEGNLYGNNYTIKNMVIIADTPGNYGLFAENYGKIYSLKIEGYIEVSAENVNAGMLAGINHSNVYSISATGSGINPYMIRSNDNSSSNVGGIIGINNGNMTGNNNSGHIYSTSNAGGITGVNNGTYYSGTNKGKIDYYFYRENASIGGLAGIQNSGSIQYFTNYGIILYTGGISNSTILQPVMGQFVGRLNGGTISNSNLSGTTNKGSLRTIGNHNQALYVDPIGNGIGRN